VAHAATCREFGIRHLRTQPYRPQTNGNAERFIQTMLLREWAIARLLLALTSCRGTTCLGTTP
jgi:transposase InsO family protein